MKNIILTSAILTFVLVTNLTAFGQDNKNVEKAKKDNQEHQKETIKSEQNSFTKFQKYQIECERKISENDKKIAKLKEKKTGSNKKKNEKTDKRIIALEHENDEFKKKMEGFNANN